MKRLVLLSSLLAVFFLPDFAQSGPLIPIQIPLKQLVIPENKVPPALDKSIRKDFMTGKVMQWYTFPYLFKKYGWQVLNKKEMNGKLKPDRYAVYIKASDGSRIDAVYTSNGKLIREREVMKDVALPEPILDAISTSKYKDWSIDKDKILITDGIKNTKEYIVKMENGTHSKTLYYDEDGSVLPVT